MRSQEICQTREEVSDKGSSFSCLIVGVLKDDREQGGERREQRESGDIEGCRPFLSLNC